MQSANSLIAIKILPGHHAAGISVEADVHPKSAWNILHHETVWIQEHYKTREQFEFMNTSLPEKVWIHEHYKTREQFEFMNTALPGKSLDS